MAGVLSNFAADKIANTEVVVDRAAATPARSRGTSDNELINDGSPSSIESKITCQYGVDSRLHLREGPDRS